MDDLEEISKKIHTAIFSIESTVFINGQNYKIRRFSKSGVSYIDFDDYRFIQQNPKKQSQWGKKAREGHKILWVITNGIYVAQVFDEEFRVLKKEKSL